MMEAPSFCSGRAFAQVRAAGIGVECFVKVLGRGSGHRHWLHNPGIGEYDIDLAFFAATSL
jgi:hypothetical protein